MAGAPDEDPAADEPLIESKLEEAFDRIVEEGEQRLGRGWLEMTATGTMAGFEVGIGILVMLIVVERTGSKLLGALAFSIGFLALLLGHSELFTEGFLVPVTACAAKRASWLDLLRFWAVTLITNLIGGWVVTLLSISAFPEIRQTARASASQFVDAGMDARTVSLGLLAGAVITLMTRMQHGTESDMARITAAVAAAFVLAGLPLFHSILDSLVIFSALHAGHTRFGYWDWSKFLGWSVLWNIVGGVGLVTFLRLVRSRQRVSHERDEAAH
jgi:formate/nitrite transporter FocA (FNT family)